MKPCPFCGGDPEIDTQQTYRNFVTVKLESAIAVYCIQCSANITVCKPDVPDICEEQVIAMWDARTSPTADQLRQAKVEVLREAATMCRDNHGTASLTAQQLDSMADELEKADAIRGLA